MLAESTWTVGKVAQFLETYYPPQIAESWDKNGLIVGDRKQYVHRILVAVDPLPEVVEQAVDGKYDLLVTHHPLLLRGVHSVSEDDWKGQVISQLIRNQISLYNCHTNADAAAGGVAWALANKIGLVNCQPLVPVEPQLIENEWPQFGDNRWGLGRIGFLSEPMKLKDLAALVAGVLPASPGGLLVGGDLEAEVQTVAVSPGSGDSFLDLVRAQAAEVYICADLRHHPATEHLANGKPYLFNLTHWASEHLWVEHCVALLNSGQAKENGNLTVTASDKVTEPWTAYYPTGLRN